MGMYILAPLPARAEGSRRLFGTARVLRGRAEIAIALAEAQYGYRLGGSYAQAGGRCMEDIRDDAWLTYVL